MRRNGTRIGITAVILLAFVVTGFVAYGRGKTAGQTAASSDRSSFGQARGTSVAGGGGFGGSGQRSGGAGGQSAGGTTSAVVGKVTKVDNGTLTLQAQPSNTTDTVATNASTTVTTFALGTLSDLATGAIVALQGDKTGDTAYTATTIYALNGTQGGGRAGRTQGGTDTAAGTAAAGSPPTGGRGRNATSTVGSSPASRGASTGISGLNGPTGRITQISGGTLTLQGFDGSTTTVTTNASTSVRTETPGTVSDIKVGDTVSVQRDPTGGATAPARAITDLGAGT
ncbi:MAG: DUF5666 domain-containing protein [Thermomicrobia bacterium]|nr:DUF5666 domain-containing protein [Thermomicrobia bacterium]